jgi:hypothetical protein
MGIEILARAGVLLPRAYKPDAVPRSARMIGREHLAVLDRTSGIGLSSGSSLGDFARVRRSVIHPCTPIDDARRADAPPVVEAKPPCGR